MPSNAIERHHIGWEPEHLVGVCWDCHHTVIHARPDPMIAEEVALWRPGDTPSDKLAKRHAIQHGRYKAKGDSIRARVRVTQRAYRRAEPEKVRATEQAYRDANRETLRIKGRARSCAYRTAHRDKRNAKQRAAYAENPEKFRAYQRAYRKANPEKFRAYPRAYRKD